MSSRNAAVPGKARGASQNQAACWDLGAVTVTNCSQILSHAAWQVFSPVPLHWMSEASKKALKAPWTFSSNSIKVMLSSGMNWWALLGLLIFAWAFLVMLKFCWQGFLLEFYTMCLKRTSTFLFSSQRQGFFRRGSMAIEGQREQRWKEVLYSVWDEQWKSIQAKIQNLPSLYYACKQVMYIGL